MQDKKEKRLRRHHRVRVKIVGTKDRLRLSVFRSDKHIFAQLINDEDGTTILAVSDKNLVSKETKGQTKSDKSFAVGKLLAEKAREKDVKKIVFDRGSYVYAGRVKKIAEGARDGGLEF
ncbi:MAG: 50S ribosomal protein L18 [Parcubacteria group bacterium GW2011_GWB1_41_4]|nr:MAG: 50S ribosomal protein L18 [Parcubacteria group bacterium GW2011_GWB1_41_4]